ncbi:EamA family transporter RarD [Spiractinospora alimapuensis]|uniref:EamA family transporter RarD n=1 Tax=Spiractinospora alimapuensis TaxID=2820884 RepID=UPI001EEAA79E|nr:EamA family transporter RarD [Spiractinospora alimapuensis]QVQ52132.1 EamA family transporter RarD [Spiractinospora alimapuensis]
MSETQRGVLFGIGAYTLWGLTPLFWILLQPATAIEILAHRIVWALVFVVLILAVLRQWAWLRSLTPRKLWLLALAAIVVTVNWGTYIYAVTSGHVIEGALGYFINPLVSVLFGVLLLRERLTVAQWIAVGLGAVAVTVLAIDYGRLPWFALVLAFSFGTYGLIKKHVNTGAAQSLAVESALLAVPAAGFLVFLRVTEADSFGDAGPYHLPLLAAAGLITLLPMLLFTGAATRVPLSSLGVMQYIAPSMQFLLGITVFAEEMPLSRWVGFVIVWAALSLFTWDALRRARREAAARRPAPV